jgi:formate hydrogenlyase subunit 3/multisubunit Na+/H+ antiporter MnhD subunit
VNLDMFMDPTMPIEIVLSSIAALLGTSLIALLVGRCRCVNGLVYGLTMLITSVCAAVALRQLLLGTDAQPSLYELPIGLPWLKGHFRLDLLSSFFLLIVNLLGAVSSLYGWQYGAHEKEPMRVLPFYPLFIAGMSLVTITNDAFMFLVAWEVMSMASWLLVLSTHEEKGTQHAAYVYIIMACIGTFALCLAFGLLAGVGGDYGFDAIREHHLSPVLATGVLFLTLLGAGAKAGIVPMHAWLPLAHPVAPSHISALMSGVMTKVAIYGLIRILFDLVNTPLWWWGGFVMILGGITALAGILYALMQHDLKKLLAYSTVENVGIIVIGLGLALAFKGNNLPILAGLALTAALFHVLNHSVFKSLLFLGAGSVLTATGTREMEKLGGLIHRMPISAFIFLIGALSISALPPFNGFISEWLTFQSILSGVVLPQWLLKFSLPVVGAMLALAAAFTAVCFVKVYGIVFLGRARSVEAEKAHEVGGLMLTSMGILAVLCTVIGLLPSGVLHCLRPLVTELLPDTTTPLSNANWLMLRPQEIDGSSYSGLIILAAIVFMTTALILCIHQFASNRTRRGDIWDCGFPCAQTNTQYTASSFAQPIRRIFGSIVFSSKVTINMPEPGDVRAAQFSVSLRDHLWEIFYAPIVRWINFLSEKIDKSQFLTIRSYLSLMFVFLVLLLVLVAVIQ